MASTFSPSLKLELIGAGDQNGTWGTTTNTNLGTLLEQAITGVQTITMVNANYTLSDLNGLSDEARNAVLVVGGTNSAIRNIIAPAVNKQYTIKNATIGGFAVIIKTPSSTGVSIANGATQTVFCDGTEFYIASFPSTGGTITGNLAVTGNLSSTGTLTVGGIPTIPTATAGTNTTQAASTAFVGTAVTAAIAAVLQLLYPVGANYISTLATNPATLLGFGTWARYGVGRTLVSLDSSNAIMSTVGASFGVADTVLPTHTHTATSTDAGHVHSSRDGLFAGTSGGGNVGYASYSNSASATTNTGTAVITTTVAANGASPVNQNYQPSIAVYIWNRTA